jgi:hypothetical protein
LEHEELITPTTKRINDEKSKTTERNSCIFKVREQRINWVLIFALDINWTEFFNQDTAYFDNRRSQRWKIYALSTMPP